MRNLKNYASATMRPVKKEPMVIDLEEDVICGEVNEHMMMDTEKFTEPGETNPSNMQQILCGNKIDHWYMMLLDSFREDGISYLRDNPLRSIRYEVDNGGYDKREFNPNRWSRESVTKKNIESKLHVEASTKKTTKEAGFGLRRTESPVTTEKSVDTNHQQDVDNGKKEDSERPVVIDESYKSYLIWVVENSKISRTNLEKEVQVKCEEEEMSLSDSDIIAVQDRPFLDEEDSPFVPSKNYEVIDLEEERGECDQPNSWFKKEIMNILKKPYKEEEYNTLYEEASVCRVVTKCRELRDGRDLSYVTNQTGPSYLDMYPKFKRMLVEARLEEDHRRALNLLRGFMFYLTKVARDDAFKPWRSRECLKIRCS